MTSAKNAPFANIFWFPVAAVFATIMLPWSVLGFFGLLPVPEGLTSIWGHGHEMVFGYAMAVVAGYLLGPQNKSYVFVLIGLWLFARISFLFWPQSLASNAANIAFMLLLLYKVLPVFLRRGRRWRNKSLAVIVLGLFASLLAFIASRWQALPELLAKYSLFEAILFLSALMFFMGGRMMGPALTPYLKQKNRILKDSVHSDLEAAGLIVLAALLVCRLLPFIWAEKITALLLLAIAGIALLRLYRWQVWLCIRQADLAALIVGYSWLIVGWVLIAFSLLGAKLQLTLAFHAITVGALGTLTFTVMARGRMHRCLKSPNALPYMFLLAALISVAAILRLSVFNLPYMTTLIAATVCWTVAFLGLSVLMIVLSIKTWREAKAYSVQ